MYLLIQIRFSHKNITNHFVFKNNLLAKLLDSRRFVSYNLFSNIWEKSVQKLVRNFYLNKTEWIFKFEFKYWIVAKYRVDFSLNL